MQGKCYNCGCELNPDCWFWLIIDREMENCWAFDLIYDYDIPDGQEAIEIEYCPNCEAEQ